MLRKPENPAQKEDNEDTSIWAMVIPKVKQTFFLMLKPRMLCVIPLEIYRALLNAYYSGELVNHCMKQRHDENPDTVKRAQLAATIMITLGVMEVVGAMVTGRLIKRFGKRFGVHFLSAIGLICCIYMISLLAANVDFGWPYYIAAALWGFADSSISTSLIALLASEFEDKEASLGVNGFVESIMKFVGYLIFMYELVIIIDH